MIIDARSLPNNEKISTDVCIIGAGVAGISLARELIGQPYEVALLESGGFEGDKQTQALYDGENIGLPYYPLDSARSRQFGGSPNRWVMEIGNNRLGARLRPMDAIDFEQRDWVPHSGWPFDKAHLDSFYLRAQEICKAGPYVYETVDARLNGKQQPLPFGENGNVKTAIYQFVSRSVFIEDYRRELDQSPNVSTYVYANALEVEASENTQQVTAIRAGCLDGKEFTVSARLFVLAAGGIETPRLMLLSNNQQSVGLGNENDLIGRFFMEHPHHWSGLLVPTDRSVFDRAELYDLAGMGMRSKNGVLGQLALSEDVLREEKILNYGAHIVPAARPRKSSKNEKKPSLRRSASAGLEAVKLAGRAIRSGDLNDLNRQLSAMFPVANEFSIAAYRKAAKLLHKYARASKRFEVFRLNHMTEQQPNPDSRVLLSSERDALGQNKTRLDWRLTAFDIRSIIRAQEIIDAEARRLGFGVVEIDMDSDNPPDEIHGGYHHMGTTRMHTDPKQCVVDANAKVHGIANLYVAGPSVFPTGGYATPALTAVALAVRLADHVKDVMART
ncbi:MAG: FAD-dependent oxidoreductase [Gammaproteobacteria bacterium]